MASKIANFASCLGKYDATLTGAGFLLDVSGAIGTSDLSLNSGYLTNSTGFVMPAATTGNGISFTGWFNPTVAEPSNYTPIFDVSCGGTQSITLCVSGNSLSPVLVGNFNGNQVYGTTATANTWNFFAYTICCSGSTMVQTLFVNGTTTSVTSGTYTALTFASTLVGYGYGTFAQQFTGKIDDFRYYGRVITPMEMRVLNSYSYGKTGFTTLVPSLGTISVTSGAVTVPFTFSNTGTYSYLQYNRVGSNGIVFTGYVSPSSIAQSGNNYTWTDSAVAVAVTYVYKFTPFISGTPGISSSAYSVYTLNPASAFTALTPSAFLANNTGFTLAWTGGTGTNITYAYSINNGTYTTFNGVSPLVLTGLTVPTGSTTPTPWAWYVDISATNLAGTTHGTTTVYAPPTPITAVISSSVSTNSFTITLTGGLGTGVTYAYTVNISSTGFTVSSTTTTTANFTSVTAGQPWTVGVTATNAYGSQTATSSSFSAFPQPIIWYKFEVGDQSGLNLYNWATGLYDASLTATNLISTSMYATGSASCYFDGTNSISIKPAILNTNSNAVAAGFNSTGWTPKNTLGYTFTTWFYNTGVDWATALFEFIYNPDHTVAIVPQDRCSFGASNYSPPPGWGANGLALNTWMFFALVFPAGSVSTSIAPTLYVYGNGADSSYNVTTQVTSEGSLGVYNYTTLNLGSNVGVMYIAGNKKLTMISECFL